MEVDGISILAGSDPRGSKCAWNVILSFPVFAASIGYFQAAKGAVAAVGIQLSIWDVVVPASQKERIRTCRHAIVVVPEIDFKTVTDYHTKCHVRSLLERSVLDLPWRSSKAVGSEIEIKLFRLWRGICGEDWEVAGNGNVASSGAFCCVDWSL